MTITHFEVVKCNRLELHFAARTMSWSGWSWSQILFSPFCLRLPPELLVLGRFTLPCLCDSLSRSDNGVVETMSSISVWFWGGHVGRHRMLEVRKHTHDQIVRRETRTDVTKMGVRQLKVHAVG